MIHESIEEYLTQNKMSEAELAEKIGVTQAYVNMMKKGERRPSPELAQKIEAVTGIPFKNLLLPDGAA